MRLAPLIAHACFLASTVLGYLAWKSSKWSMSKEGPFQGNTGLWEACVQPFSIKSVSLPQECISLTREAASALYSSLGDEKPESHVGMLIATRVLVIITVAAGALGAFVTLLMATKATMRPKLWSLLPLLLCAVLITTGVLSVVFGGVLHVQAFKAKQALLGSSLGPGWVEMLVATSIGGAALLPLVAELVVPAIASMRTKPNVQVRGVEVPQLQSMQGGAGRGRSQQGQGGRPDRGEGTAATAAAERNAKGAGESAKSR